LRNEKNSATRSTLALPKIRYVIEQIATGDTSQQYEPGVDFRFPITPLGVHKYSYRTQTAATQENGKSTGAINYNAALRFFEEKRDEVDAARQRHLETVISRMVLAGREITPESVRAVSRYQAPTEEKPEDVVGAFFSKKTNKEFITNSILESEKVCAKKIRAKIKEMAEAGYEITIPLVMQEGDFSQRYVEAFFQNNEAFIKKSIKESDTNLAQSETVRVLEEYKDASHSMRV
jgi:hypothetical protein